MKCALAAAGFINGDIEYNKAVLADTLGKCAGKADAVIFGEAFLQGFDSLNFTAGHDSWLLMAHIFETILSFVSHVLCGDLQDTPELDEQVFNLIFRTLQPYMLP